MSKKLIAACMAIAAFAAFVLPATASAVTPELTHPTGTRLATGVGLKGTNVGPTKFKGTWGEVTCSTATMTGKLTKNAGTGEAVEGTIETATFTGTGAEGKCTSIFGDVRVTTNVGNGTPWCVRALAANDELQIRGNSCANAARSITYVLDFPTFTCAYERTTATGPVKGTYATDTGASPSDAVGTIKPEVATSEFKIEAGQSGFCPASGTLEMSFTLETDTATAEPLYFS